MNDAIDLKKFLRRLVVFEGFKLKAYKDSVGIPTIGIGTIRYPNGTAVKMGDAITEAQAYEYASTEASHMFGQLRGMLKVNLNENQLIALLCLMYNIGVSGLRNSTVLKSINTNASLTEIEVNWMKWNKGTVKGKLTEIPGLAARRKTEVKIFAGTLLP